MQFRSSRETAIKATNDVLSHWETLTARLKAAQSANAAAKCALDYSPAIETVAGKQAQLTGEKKKMEIFCDEREQRWTWCLQRNQLIHNMDKVLNCIIIMIVLVCQLTIDQYFFLSVCLASE